MMQERFFSHNSSALSSILRNTVNRINSSYIVSGSRGGTDPWRHSFGGRGGSSGLGAHHPVSSLLASTSGIKVKGRQLLDQEGLSCLLIVLFIDDPKINSARLHRILRNLCYHAPTRDWVIKSLLSILEKSNDKSAAFPPISNESEMPPAAKMRKGNQSNAEQPKNHGPSWLTISMDAALGFRANVFQVTRVAAGKKTSSSSSSNASNISIHPGASAVVCRHTLEVLIYLAKPFSEHFLPWSALPSASTSSSSSKSNDFWDTLLKLDQITQTNKKGKSVARSHSSVGSLKEVADLNNISDGQGPTGEDGEASNFENTPFGQLLGMLSSPVIRRNSVLTDKLLRLLSLISIVQQPTEKKEDKDNAGDKSPTTPTKSLIRSEHLKLAVEVLTSKTCSEEGLEDVTALLLNLSGPEMTRETILGLLLQGAQELGAVVRQNILDLQSELQGLKSASEEAEDPGSSSHAHEKGAVIDRFTRAAVVISAPSKVKGGPELQLPSMNALTNKTSSQAFFLRVLKVIIQLRDAALHAMKKSKLEAAKKAAAAKEASTATNETSANAEEQDKKEETPMEIDPSLPSLSDQLSLNVLWDALSSCLRDLADTPDHHAVLVLQATVEAFFLVHAAPTQPEDKKKVQQKETRQEQLAHIQEQTFEPGQTSTASENPSSPPSSSSVVNSNSAAAGASTSNNLPVETQKFLAFAETHRTVLNQILRQSTVHLADGPFSVLVDHTRVLDFDIKRK